MAHLELLKLCAFLAEKDGLNRKTFFGKKFDPYEQAIRVNSLLSPIVAKIPDKDIDLKAM